MTGIGRLGKQLRTVHAVSIATYSDPIVASIVVLAAN